MVRSNMDLVVRDPQHLMRVPMKYKLRIAVIGLVILCFGSTAFAHKYWWHHHYGHHATPVYVVPTQQANLGGAANSDAALGGALSHALVSSLLKHLLTNAVSNLPNTTPANNQAIESLAGRVKALEDHKEATVKQLGTIDERLKTMSTQIGFLIKQRSPSEAPVEEHHVAPEGGFRERDMPMGAALVGSSAPVGGDAVSARIDELAKALQEYKADNQLRTAISKEMADVKDGLNRIELLLKNMKN